MRHHTLVALVQDRPGVLNRAVSVFRRRGINIESLTVTRTEREGLSRMTWIVTADSVAPVLAQLEKLIDVLEVRDLGAPGAGVGGELLRLGAKASWLTQADGIA